MIEWQSSFPSYDTISTTWRGWTENGQREVYQYTRNAFSGTKSPEYLRVSIRKLGEAIPQAKHVVFGGLDHSGSWNRGPEVVGEAQKRFFVGMMSRIRVRCSNLRERGGYANVSSASVQSGLECMILHYRLSRRHRSVTYEYTVYQLSTS